MIFIFSSNSIRKDSFTFRSSTNVEHKDADFCMPSMSTPFCSCYSLDLLLVSLTTSCCFSCHRMVFVLRSPVSSLNVVFSFSVLHTGHCIYPAYKLLSGVINDLLH